MRFLAASTLLLPSLVSAIAHPATIAVGEPTIAASSSTSIPESAAEPSPQPASDAWVAIQTILPTPINPQPALPTTNPLDAHLELREIVNAPAAAQASDPTQVSPVTTLSQWEQVNGVAQQVQVVYSQAFSAVPDQLSPPQAGVIGLGTIAGKIGVVKTVAARSAEQTLAARNDDSNGSRKVTGASSVLALLVALAALMLA